MARPGSSGSSSSSKPAGFKHPTIAELFGAQLVSQKEREQHQRTNKVSPHVSESLQPVRSVSNCGRSNGSSSNGAGTVTSAGADGCGAQPQQQQQQHRAIRKRKRWTSADHGPDKLRVSSSSSDSDSASSSSSSSDTDDEEKPLSAVLATVAGERQPGESAADALARQMLGGFRTQLSTTAQMRAQNHERAKSRAAEELGGLMFAQRYRPTSITEMKLHSRHKMADHDRDMMVWLESRRAEPLIGYQAALVSGPCGSGKDLWAELRLRESGYTTIVKMAHGDTVGAALEGGGGAASLSLSLNDKHVALSLDWFYNEGCKASLASAIGKTAILISDIDAFDSESFSVSNLCKLLTLHLPKVGARVKKRRAAKRKQEQDALKEASGRKGSTKKSSWRQRGAEAEAGADADADGDSDQSADERDVTTRAEAAKPKTASAGAGAGAGKSRRRKLGLSGNKASAEFFSLPAKYATPILCPIILTTSCPPKTSRNLRTLVKNVKHFALDAYPERALDQMAARIIKDQQMQMTAGERLELVKLCQGDAQKLHVMLQYYKCSTPMAAPIGAAGGNTDPAGVLNQTDAFFHNTFRTTQQLYNGSLQVIRPPRHIHGEFCVPGCSLKYVVREGPDALEDPLETVMPAADLIEPFAASNWLPAFKANSVSGRSQGGKKSKAEGDSLADIMDMAELAAVASDTDTLTSAGADFFDGVNFEASALLSCWALPTLVKRHLKPSLDKKLVKRVHKQNHRGQQARGGGGGECGGSISLVTPHVNHLDPLYRASWLATRHEDRECRPFDVEFPSRSIGPFRPPKQLIMDMSDLSRSALLNMQTAARKRAAAVATETKVVGAAVANGQVHDVHDEQEHDHQALSGSSVDYQTIALVRNYSDWWIAYLGPGLCYAASSSGGGGDRQPQRAGAKEWLSDYAECALEVKEAKIAERKRNKLDKEEHIRKTGKPPPRKRQKLAADGTAAAGAGGADATKVTKGGKRIAAASKVDPLQTAILASRKHHQDKGSSASKGMLFDVSHLLRQYGFTTHKQVVELVRLSELFAASRAKVAVTRFKS